MNSYYFAIKLQMILNLFTAVVKRSYSKLTTSLLVFSRYKAPFEIGLLDAYESIKKTNLPPFLLNSFSYFAAYFLSTYSSLKIWINIIIFLLY